MSARFDYVVGHFLGTISIMTRKWESFVTWLAGMFVVFSPALAFAAGLPKQIVTCNGAVAGNGLPACSVCDIAIVAQNVLNTAIFILVALSAVLFAWAGWKMLIAQGDTESYSAGKRIFGNVVLGLVILLMGWIVIDTLMRTMLGSDFGPWNKIC